MKLTIEPTEAFFMAGAVMCRMWQGVDQDGAEVVALVSMVAFKGDAQGLAERLVSIPPPDAAAAKRWANSVLAGTPGNIGCD